MIANVLAALRSLFELVSFCPFGDRFLRIDGFTLCAVIFLVFLEGVYCGGQLCVDGYATEISAVGGSNSIGSSIPLA